MKISFISTFLLLSVSLVLAQNKVTEAFANSYSYQSQNNFIEAIKSINDVTDASCYECFLRTGYLYYASKQHAESEKAYAKAIALKPYSIEAKLGYVLPLAELGNWAKVISTYQEILKIDPQNSTANYRLGLIYYNTANYTEAYKYFDKLINLYPFDYYGLLMQGWTCFRLGKNSDAKILFNKVLMYQPNDSSALEGLSLIK